MQMVEHGQWREPELSQAGKLAADIAMARDVLANLHHAA